MNIKELILKLIETLNPAALWEGIKEGLRVTVISVVPIVLTGVSLTTGEVNINWLLVKAVAFVAVVRLVDKWMHEVGKDNDNPTLTRGLTQF